MVLEWRDREHEDMDQEAMRDAPTLQALQRSGLLNFYCTSNMRAQVHLLETLVGLWDHDLGLFDLQGKTLEFTVDDIYFITKLSRRGTPVNLEGIGWGSDPLSVQYYVNTNFFPETKKLGTQIPILQITSFPLKVMVSMVARVAGSSMFHLATLTHMRVAVECM